jgi:hypothetical protein
MASSRCLARTFESAGASFTSVKSSDSTNSQFAMSVVDGENSLEEFPSLSRLRFELRGLNSGRDSEGLVRRRPSQTKMFCEEESQLDNGRTELVVRSTIGVPRSMVQAGLRISKEDELFHSLS